MKDVDQLLAELAAVDNNPELAQVYLRHLCLQARAALIAARAMPGRNELLARGAEYLGDGVYTLDTGLHVELTGNAYGRHNVILLEPREYAALRRWAKAHGYEP